MDALHKSALLEARKLVSGVGFSQTPVELFGMARALGAKLVFRTDLYCDGYLTREHDGTYCIYLRRTRHVRRQRFTLAHELGHLLINRLGRQPLWREHRGIPTAQGEPDSREERAANRIAAELLMPLNLFSEALPPRSRSWDHISQLASLFNVSEDAVLYRITELPCCWSFLLRLETARLVGSRQSAYYRAKTRGTVALRHDPIQEAHRILRESLYTSQHELEIYLGDETERLVGVGLHREPLGPGTLPSYWVAAWEKLS